VAEQRGLLKDSADARANGFGELFKRYLPGEALLKGSLLCNGFSAGCPEYTRREAQPGYPVSTTDHVPPHP
jgi:hypothetical protein